MKDTTEIVQMRGQRVHHTEVLHSPWYGQHQSPTVPGFFEVTKDVKLNWNLENKGLATLINSFTPFLFSTTGWLVVHGLVMQRLAITGSVGQLVSWSDSQTVSQLVYQSGFISDNSLSKNLFP